MTGMVPHHRGAIAMSELALRKSATPAVQQVAQTVIDDQSREISQMTHWLKDWYNMEPPGGTQMPEHQMSELMPSMEGQMPDLAARMQRLQGLSGAAFDIEDLSALADHHAMAVQITGPVLASGWHEDLYRAAEHTATSQGQEVAQIQDLLFRLYGLTIPLPGPAMPASAGG